MRAEVKKKINNFSLSVVDKTLIFYFDQFKFLSEQAELEDFRSQQTAKCQSS
jgi:hypothetical protein